MFIRIISTYWTTMHLCRREGLSVIGRKESVSSDRISTGSFILTFFTRLFEDEYNSFMSISYGIRKGMMGRWDYLLELARDRRTYRVINKALKSEERKAIKEQFSVGAGLCSLEVEMEPSIWTACSFNVLLWSECCLKGGNHEGHSFHG